MQDQRRRKRGPRTHYSAAQKGNGHRRLGRGGVAGWPDHQQGVLPVSQPLKAIACVQVLTKPRLSSFSTMWNFAGNLALWPPPKADGGWWSEPPRWPLDSAMECKADRVFAAAHAKPATAGTLVPESLFLLMLPQRLEELAR